MKKRERGQGALKRRGCADEATLRAILSDRNDLTLAELPSTEAPLDPQPCCVTLLLRAHAEQSFLRREVLPVLSQLEAPGELDCAERAAALAFLEVSWLQAQLRAFTTDLTHASIIAAGPPERDSLRAPAERYYRNLRALRAHTSERIKAVVEADRIAA
jgi:hypothetical protein